MQNLTPGIGSHNPRGAASGLPYRRNYGRLLVVVAVVATLCFPQFQDRSTWGAGTLRGLIGTFALSIGLLWAPALFYAGIRAKCTADWTIALIGLATLLFWIPWLIQT